MAHAAARFSRFEGNFASIAVAGLAAWLLWTTAAGADPVTGPSLVLWLDSQDVDGDGQRGKSPAPGTPIARWADKSDYANHANQAEPDRRPAFAQDGAAGTGGTIRFTAAKRQYLSVTHAPSLELSQITAFVVARASSHTANMWLFSKNCFASPWTGYGIAVHGGQVSPWPHLGLGGRSPGENGYLLYNGTIRNGLALVEIVFDGRRLDGLINATTDKVQMLAGSIRANDRNLLIGASPQNLPATEFLEGDIAEILVYDRALNDAQRGRTRSYLAAKHGLTIAEASNRMVVIDNGYLPLIVDHPTTPETRSLTPDQATAAVRRDWLFQADHRGTVSRSLHEIRWARQLASRLMSRRPAVPDLSREVGELDALEKRASTMQDRADAAEHAPDLYFAVRQVKRRIMLKNPVLDFSQLLFIDQPYPQGPEWKHQAIHRMGHRAVPGGRLLVLEGLHPGGRVRKLFPEKPGSFWRPDLSFDASRVLFCYKAHDEASFHLYEMNLDGKGVRQLTHSEYDDVDPIYLPDGHVLFTTTRGNSYVRCGPYIYSYVLARSDADGGNVYLISRNGEPDFVPALLNDGRVVYSRWEYTDKDLMRVQSLWTTNQDGTRTSAFWGNQSVWPDHLAEPRPIPGTGRVMFTGVGHHDWFSGSIGIVDPRHGFNFPHGLTKVTCDLPWAEVPQPPVDSCENADYHASGAYSGYLGPYPLSEEDFLVSARGEGDQFRLYLMDVYGNRELIYEGVYNAWYPLPVRPRRVPPRQPDAVRWPGTGSHRQPVAPGTFYSADVYRGVPDLPRGMVKYLRVIQQDAKTYSTWRKTFRLSGPPVSIIQEEAVKRIVSVAPVEDDGSVYFQVPAGKALYFQLLDEHYRALHTMRSFTGLMPGESRGCVGCHETHGTTPPARTGLAFRRGPSKITPPPWGTESIGYERFVQPVLDRYCGECHQGEGEARPDLDLTLRPGWDVFKEPYLTLVGSAAWVPGGPTARDQAPLPKPDRPGYGIAAPIPVQTMATHNDPEGYATLRPMRYLSCKSPLIEMARSGEHYDVKVDPASLRRLIGWVDADSPFMGERELRALGDPDFAGIDQLPIRPRVKTAPVIERP